MSSPHYLLDTNVFIQAFNRYYAFDLVPQFWSELVECARQGRLRSVDRVLDEINRVDDDLKEWANGEFGMGFESTKQSDVVGAYAKIVAWARKRLHDKGSV